jgi:hypothetical protein
VKQLFGSGKLHRLSYEWIVVVGNLALLFEGNKSEHEGPRNLDVIAVKDSVNYVMSRLYALFTVRRHLGRTE